MRPGMMAENGGAEALPPQAPAMMGGEDCVPVEALAMPDEKEQMLSPEVGAPVNYQVSGTVTRIEGDKAYVKREAINGKPLNDEADEPAGQSEDTELAGLKEQAAGMGGF